MTPEDDWEEVTQDEGCAPLPSAPPSAEAGDLHVLLRRAITAVAEVSDGAASQDGFGFRPDEAARAHALAEQVRQGHLWTAQEAREAYRILATRRHQLKELAGVEFDEISNPAAEGGKVLLGVLLRRLKEGETPAVCVRELLLEQYCSEDLSAFRQENPAGFDAVLLDLQQAGLRGRCLEVVERASKHERAIEGRHDGDADDKETQAQTLTRMCDEAGVQLFHSPDGDAYAIVPVGQHRELLLVRSKHFKRWLVRQYFECKRKPPTAQATIDTIGVLEANALFDNDEHAVFIRVAVFGIGTAIDVGDPPWRCIEVLPDGWRVVPHSVRFRRARGMLALPEPARGGNLLALQNFLNLGPPADKADKADNTIDAQWVLLVCWVTAVLLPRGPYPVLVLHGEQGSGKSTVARVLRCLVDPSTVPLRAPPRDERDLMIAARNSWLLALDNLSTIQPWLSDAICRLSTGGGFSTRELFSDAEEVLFDSMRPVLLTGIEELTTREDLLDRCLLVFLNSLNDEERLPEREFWNEFTDKLPQILGALLDVVAAALRELPYVRLERPPRMADFAVWGVAVERALQWPPGTFLDAYLGNREEAVGITLDGDLIASAVKKLHNANAAWQGTSTELLSSLSQTVEERERKSKAWPQNPRTLGNRLRRLAPSLRRAGIHVQFRREGKARRRIIEIAAVSTSASSASSASNTGQGCVSDYEQSSSGRADMADMADMADNASAAIRASQGRRRGEL